MWELWGARNEPKAWPPQPCIAMQLDFELPNGDNDKPDDEREGQRIYIDEHFLGFTPLSPAEVQETQTIEYEHHEIRVKFLLRFPNLSKFRVRAQVEL